MKDTIGARVLEIEEQVKHNPIASCKDRSCIKVSKRDNNNTWIILNYGIKIRKCEIK